MSKTVGGTPSSLLWLLFPAWILTIYLFVFPNKHEVDKYEKQFMAICKTPSGFSLFPARIHEIVLPRPGAVIREQQGAGRLPQFIFLWFLYWVCIAWTFQPRGLKVILIILMFIIWPGDRVHFIQSDPQIHPWVEGQKRSFQIEKRFAKESIS